MRYRSCSAVRPLSLRRTAMLLILAVIYLASACVDGAPVSSTDSERAAQAFLYSEASRSSAYRAAVGIPEGVRVKGATELRDSESADLLGYVLAVDPSGYIVVPSETRLVPVIAYSYAGEFPWEESEENILLSMLRLDLRLRHKALSEKGVAQSIPDSNEALWGTYLGAEGEAPAGDSPTVYGPWLSTEWHQGSPYNDLCPWDAVHEGRTVVGCTATALAQILNYWKYPTAVTFTAGDSYTSAKHGFAINASAASFSGLDYTTGEPSDADKARLSCAAGVSVRMDYCSKGSGARVEYTAAALAGGWCPDYDPDEAVPKRRWGYASADLRSYDFERSEWGWPCYVTEESFFTQLADNMVAAQPAEMAVSSVHAVVVDGWQSGGRVYHLNYGWAGNCSGWYSLPEGMPAGHTVIDCAVLNIRPSVLGNLYTFGRNSGSEEVGGGGQLGLGDTSDRLSPVGVSGLQNVVCVAALAGASVVLLQNGDVYTFGKNTWGDLGQGDTVDRLLPTKVGGIINAVAIAAGYDHVLVLLANGDVYAFGANNAGQLGIGVSGGTRTTPVRVASLSGVKSIAAGAWHSLFLLTNGDVYSCGWGRWGALGHGSETNRSTPKRIDGLANAAGISAGDQHSLVLLQSGEVYAFGLNDHGQLGLGDFVNRLAPQGVTSLSTDVSAVDAGYYHSVFLLGDGRVLSCGYNDHGQLGLGDRVARSTPMEVVLPAPAASVAAGSHSLVALRNGEIYSFGGNSFGGLGLGDTADRLSPTQIVSLSGVTASSVGGGHSLVAVEALPSPPPPPSSPTNVLASDATCADWVHVSWDAVSGAASYTVHRAAGPNETFVRVWEATDTSYDDTDVNPGQVYWYKIAACNDSGCSDLSSVDSGYASVEVVGTSGVFRVTSSGDVRADGAFYGADLFVGSADVAEWVSVSDAVEVGTVLELDVAHPGGYRPSQTPCSAMVAGVVSTQPGVTLGASTIGPQQALLALSGIVPVKVTNEGGPIQPGDLLVSSSTHGYAMRWAGPEAIPCALVGKALEPMTAIAGTILVLLTAH